MKITKIILGLGAILIAFGFLFQFQGRGTVGPESSFMYYNKDWIDYGVAIIISGIIIIGIGIFASRRTR